MVLQILIAFISLLVLVILHELGHFFVAKKFNVKVEEFGIGLPPRLFGKKFGETLYSFNLLPFGAFVRLYGEEGEEEKEKQRSFSQKAIWQRMGIVLGGIVAFWLVAALIFSFLMTVGAPSVVEDSTTTAKNPQVHIAGIAGNSPAQQAGLKAGDIIKQFSVDGSQFPIDKMEQVRKLAEQYKGQEVSLTIQRGKETFRIALVPRMNPPNGEGPLGISLVRVGLISYPWWQAPFRGIQATIEQSWNVLQGWKIILINLFHEGSLPKGAQLSGPVGILFLFAQAAQNGIPYFLQFLAIIAIYLAFFNALPIPAVDGGKFFFLFLEALRKKPLPRELEQKITFAFFLALIVLFIVVTMKDISRIV
jgi:regulator of sigma E protease